MSDSITITQATNKVTVTAQGSVGLNAGGQIDGNLEVTGTLAVGGNQLGKDVRFWGATANKYFLWDASQDKVIITGDLQVDGTTTTINSTVVSIADPVFSLGGTSVPTSSDSKDRGIEHFYWDSTAGSGKRGFFGWSNADNAYKFLTDCPDPSGAEIFTGTAATVQLGHLNFVEGSGGQIQFNGTEKINIGTNNIGLRKPIYGMVSTIDIGLSSNPFRDGFFSGAVTVGAGSAGSPSLTFSSDSDTGFFNRTAGELNVAIGGSWIANFQSTGLKIYAGTGIFNRNGSAAAPSFTFGDDTDTGMYRKGADALGFSTGGTERVSIDSSGDVTLSTATPTIAIQSGSNEAEGSKIRLTEGATFNGAFIHYDGSANALNIGVHDPFNSTLSDDTNVITIPRDTGRVGIGTAAPSQKLTVEGNIELGTGGYIYGDTTTPYLRLSNAAGAVLGYSNAYISLGETFVYNSGGTERFRIVSSTGNVGINTSAPSGKLTSYVSATRQINLHSGSIGADFSVICDNSGNPAVQIKGTGTADLFSVLDNTTEVFKIADGGNVSVDGNISLDGTHKVSFGQGHSIAASGSKLNIIGFDNSAGINLITQGSAGGKAVNFQTGTHSSNFATVASIDDSGNLSLEGGITVEGPSASADGLHLKQQNYISFSDASSVYSRFRSSSTGIFQFQDGSYNIGIQLRTSGNSYFNGGSVSIGTTAPSDFATIAADDLVIKGANDTGITIATGNTTKECNINFSDGSGADSYRGTIQYKHVDDSMRLYAAAGERLRLESGGLVRVFGDLQVDGTTTTVNSTVVTIDDPVLTLGGDTAPSSDDNKDRGIEFRYYDGSAKVGFMGWDDSAGGFTLLKDATNSSEVFSGTAATLSAGAGNFVNSTTTVSIANSVYVPISISNTAGYAHAKINGFEIGGNTTATSEGYIKTSDNTRRLYLDTNGWRFVKSSAADGEVMRLTPDGDLGIGGITAPATKVHILNGTGNDPHIRLSDPNSSSTNDATGYLEVYHGNTTGRAGYFGMITNAEMAMATTCSSGNIGLYTGSGVRALSIDNSQRVGIGTTSPTGKLHVNVPNHNTVSLQLGNDQYTGGNPTHDLLMLNTGTMTWYLPDDGTTPGDLQFYSRHTSSYPFVIDSENSRVGVNNTSPAYTLDVVAGPTGTGNTYAARILNEGNHENRDVLLLQGGDDSFLGTTKFIVLADGDGTESAWIQGAVQGANGGVAINTTAADASNFVIDESGNVGINNGSPTCALDVTGGIRFSTGSVADADLTFQDGKRAQFGNSNDLTIQHNGSVTRMVNNTGQWSLEQQAAGQSLVMEADNGSGGVTAYLTLDGGNERINFAKPTQHADGVYFNMGSGNDFDMRHNGTDFQARCTTGAMNFLQATADQDLTLQADNGSGSPTPYITLDGSAETVVASKPLIQTPGTVDPANNGELAFTVVSNTSIKIKYKGTDGTVRSTTLTLS